MSAALWALLWKISSEVGAFEEYWEPSFVNHSASSFRVLAESDRVRTDRD